MIAIKVPPLGESIVEATISRWLKGEGDTVSAGETLIELETDKITVEVPALGAGVLTKRLKQEGDVVNVDEQLGEIDDKAAAGATTAQPSAPTPAPATPAAPTPAPPPSPVAAPAAEVRASPAAQRLAAESGLNIGTVPGTGRGGVVSKPDVVHAMAATPAAAPAPAAQPAASPRPAPPPPAPAPAPAPVFAPAAANGNGARETREKMTTRRRRIAENLLASQQQTAHLTTFNEIDMSAVTALRERVRERVEKEQGVRLSFMPFFVKAAVMALQQYPLVNASIDGDSIVYHNYVNMGIAVASDAGLVVPNIKDAQAKGVLDVSRDIVAIAKRARDGKLTMDDLTGGTFTITNGGVFGSLISTPIINYPQVGILGLHKTQDRPVAVGGQVVIRPMMYVALSYDHRLIDGQQAVLFLVRVKELMEDPAAMLIA
ncbi:dihydrolipoyllysine-residue succinyltransferase component of 2-oxoglutarate dehydrogenase complex [Gemmatimonadetes bacterium T265]|nr:dihydrolipoyllysine-residue succinyltransferase component of 2-oxoglutarate dehydrogenase complex [Gemmatimonadetes bacterium T265]